MERAVVANDLANERHEKRVEPTCGQQCVRGDFFEFLKDHPSGLTKAW